MKLLIVDDSKVILKMAQDIIVDQQISDDVETALTGEACLKLMETQGFDVVLLDIIMPGMSGLDVLREIDRRGYLESTKVVMFTSISDRNALKESFECGASDYIHKPIDPVEFVARMKSVLRQKTLEMELHHQIKETHDKNVELKYLYDELRKTQTQMIKREQMAGIGQLAAGIAHEINNPLGFVYSNTEILKEYFTTYQEIISIYMEQVPIEHHIKLKDYKFMLEDAPNLFQDIKDGVDRIMKIVNGIRFFSGVDALTTLERYDINEGIESILLLTQSEWAGVECLRTLGEVPEIQVHSSEINQSLLNVLMNSIQAIKIHDIEKGRIEINTYLDGQYVCCQIKDNGCGIPKDVIEEVFNPFFTTKPVGSGSGLGLSIVYDAVVNTHKGDVLLESDLHKGTIFTMRLPIRFRGDSLSEED